MKQKSIKSIRQEFKDNGIFYTPPELSKKLMEYVDMQPDAVYDPVCDMEGISMNPFLKAIKRIVSEFERKEKKEDENQMKLEVGE